MKLLCVFNAVRVIDVGEPAEGQGEEDFLQTQRESMMEDPFLFIDSTDVQVSAIVAKITVPE